MLSVNGYYDGQGIIFIENPNAQKNQKVIVTLLDDFMEQKAKKAYHKFIGRLDEKSFIEITDALKDCERVDADEW